MLKSWFWLAIAVLDTATFALDAVASRLDWVDSLYLLSAVLFVALWWKERKEEVRERELLRQSLQAFNENHQKIPSKS